MERQEMLKWKKAAWQKLMGAIAMLLVASIMMSATSYAWFVLSTAPEVTDLTTTAGANGALEIALQSNKADGTGRADILSGVGQSIASKDAQTANAYWGNVVDLSTGYGLEHITLYPARLNLNGKVVNTTSMLSIPTFGTDGRVTSLKNAEKTYFKDGKFEQGQSHWGVNVMGATSNEVGDAETITLTYNRDFVLNEARTKVAEYRTSLREQMTGAIEENALDIMGTLIAFTNFMLKPNFDTNALATNYIGKMETIIADSTMAIRWALLANAAADEKHFDSSKDEDMQALGSLYAKALTMPLTGDESVQSYATQYNYEGLGDAAAALAKAANNVALASKDLKDGEAGNALSRLISYNRTFMHGSKGESGVEAVLAGIKYDFPEDLENSMFVQSDIFYMVSGTSEDDTDLFTTIASVIGDYEGVMVTYLVRIPSGSDYVADTLYWSAEKDGGDTAEYYEFRYTIKATNAKDTGSTKTAWKEWDPDKYIGVLGTVSNQINGITADGTVQVQLTRSDLSAYGYSVDLALQCSKNTNLQLQQEAVARVEGDTSGQTMGSGSTMVFDLAGDLTEAQVRKLMQGIYVVLMNTDSGEIYKIAAVDLDKLTVDQLQYPNRATGTLALYEPTIKGGVLSLGDKAASITAMTADTQLNLTALVFLNGDQVDASMFSGTQALSLTGTLNLQFASSEALTAMEYTDYAPAKTDNP